MGRKEEIIARIRESAIDDFIQKGLNGASMERIANKADISKRTLYKYYANKDLIFDDIINMLLDSFCTFSQFTYSKETPLEAQIEKIIDTKVELITSANYLKISKLVLSELLKSKSLNKKHLEKF